MAGDADPYDNPNLRGIGRYFNNSTIRGRANVAIATFVGIGLFYIYTLIPKHEENPCDCSKTDS